MADSLKNKSGNVFLFFEYSVGNYRYDKKAK